MAADTCMNREVIHSLLALFDEGVTVDFPIQVFTTPFTFSRAW